METEDGERFAALVKGYTDGMEVSIGQEVYPIPQSEDARLLYQF